MKRKILFLIFLIISIGLFGQTLSSGLSVEPSVVFPVGTKAEYYQTGFGARAGGLMGLDVVDYITLAPEIGYTFVPLALGQPVFSSDSNLSIIDVGLALRAGVPLGHRFTIFGRLFGGAYYAAMHGTASDSGAGFRYDVGLGAGFTVSDRFALTASASYASALGVHDGIAVTIGLTSRLTGSGNALIPREDFIPARPSPGNGGGYIEFMDVEFEKVFPVLYKYYDTHPIGRARIENTGRSVVEDVEIRLSLAQYIDSPKLSARIEILKQGESREVDIYCLFNESVLTITEGAKLACDLTAEYDIGGSFGVDSSTLTLETWDRNALRWDDDRKIAAFVTARDEEIQKTARNVASIVRDEGLTGFSSEFQLAIALLGTMDVFGCAYVIDPSSSYAEMSANAEAVDAIQFPRQTLQYRAGDCDDLSTAYAALLESVGVETAFITVPGHIFTAFRLNMTPAEARNRISNSHDLVFADAGGVWVPVEVTALSEGFMSAWALGGRQWRQHDADGKARLIPTREAWTTYEPVAFSTSAYEIEMPDRDFVTTLFATELQEFIDQEISRRERGLLVRIERDPGDAGSKNSLGVLYARYGRIIDAEVLFNQATPLAAAFLNLGNLAYMSGDMAAAEAQYKQALGQNDAFPAAIVGMARVAYHQDDYDEARRLHTELSGLSPRLADRYAYLGGDVAGTARATDVTIMTTVEWSD